MNIQRPTGAPGGAPIRPPAQVAGALSRIQGLLQSSVPVVHEAYAQHWLAARDAGEIPQFARVTQQALWVLYGVTALSGLLRHALSGRGTPEVLAGIVDQLNLIQQSYGQLGTALNDLLRLPEARDIDTLQAMARAFAPLARVMHALQQPAQIVINGLPVTPGAPIPGVPLQYQARYAGVERR